MNQSELFNENDYERLLSQSNDLEGAMGAIAFAVLEMFRRGGMKEAEITELHEKMKKYFMVPSNADCNAICKMLETRLQSEKVNGAWYWG